LFFPEGVKLACRGSPVVGVLSELETDSSTIKLTELLISLALKSRIWYFV